MTRYCIALAAAAGLALLAAGFAQDQSRERSNSANRMTIDNTFATNAAEGGMAEVQLGNLAKDHASSPDVKSFGQTMVDDHTKANDELKSIAAKKNITLPASLNAKDQATYDRLSKLNGAAFDKAYMRDMVSDHRTDVKEFQNEADHGADPDLKSFAGKTLPTLQHHLQLAEGTEEKVKGEK
jgi:putative membrane protein